MNINFAYRISGNGRTDTTDQNEHIRDMIEQVLFTSPGERVNRPTFGSGLMQLVFAPNSDELATATEFMVQGALQQFLGEIIKVESVDVTAEESTLSVLVQYIVKQDQRRETAEFTRTT